MMTLVALCPHPAAAQGEGPVVVPAGELELARLVDLVSRRLGLNVEYDASALTGRVTLRLDAGVDDAELWRLTNRTLASRGFTTIRLPGDTAYSVIKLSDAPNLAHVAAPRQGEADDPVRGPPPGYQAVIVVTEHRPPSDLIDPLTQVLSKPAGTVRAIGASKLLVADLSERLAPVIDVLAALDTPAEASSVVEVPLTNLTGEKMAALVEQINAKRKLATGEALGAQVLPAPGARAVLLVAPAAEIGFVRSLVESLDSRERVETLTYSPAHFAARDVAELIEQTIQPDAPGGRWKVVVDTLTGSLVITATPALHDRVQALIERLDAAPASARRPVRTFVVRNRSVADVQEILERLIAAGVLSGEAEGRRAEAGEGGGGSSSDAATNVTRMPPPPIGRERATLPTRARSGTAISPDASLTLTADDGTNTLIAVGEPRLLAQVEALLKTLDVRQPQVMLEVLMVTLSEGDTLDLGIELERLTSSGDAQIRLSSLFGLGLRADDGTSLSSGAGPGFSGVVLSPGEFSILVRALQTISEGRSLSMPKLLVGNNEEATLDAVVQQPFASVNASDTIATTSFGGTSDAGTQVSIRPQIAEGDHLLLAYGVSLSSFVGSASESTLPPPRQQNSVQSVATIPDGHTVVVGGIEIEDESRGISQVPLLGWIPGIGEAFKSRSKTSTRSRFYVFIRANILRHGGFEDLKFLSAQATGHAGIDDGWPEVEVRIIR